MKSETGQPTAGMQVQTGKHAGAFEGRLVRSELGRLHWADQVIEVGWLLVLATLWVGSYTVIKVAVETVPPSSIVAARVSIAAVVLLLLAGHQRLRLPYVWWTWRACFDQAALLNFVPFTLANVGR